MRESSLVPKALTAQHHEDSTVPDVLQFDASLRKSKWLPSADAQEWITKSKSMSARDFRFFRIEAVSHDSEYPRREALENVLSALNQPCFSFVYLLSGGSRGIEILVGVARNYGYSCGKWNAHDESHVLQGAFLGNFQGSQLRELGKEELENCVFAPLREAERGSVILGIPSINEPKGQQEMDFQGIDRLINSMAGEQWRLLVVCEPVPPEEIQQVIEQVYESYDRLHLESHCTLQQSRSKGISSSTTATTSDTRTKSSGISNTDGNSHTASSEKSSQGTSTSRTTSRNVSTARSSSEALQDGTNSGESDSITIERISKRFQQKLKYMDDELLPRLQLGLAKGLFRVSIYAMADNRAAYQRFVRTFISIFQGDRAMFNHLRFMEFPEDGEDKLLDVDTRKRLTCHFQSMEAQYFARDHTPVVYGFPTKGGRVNLSTYLTAREVSLVAGIPIREVPGLPLSEAVEFGLCPRVPTEADSIDLGSVLQFGRELETSPIRIAKADLTKHVFVAGVTGSGKTTTCQRLLTESGLPFLVVEPAKTEYRALLDKVGGLRIYTLGNETVAPFRLNPFELLPTESITGHVDMLKACFTAAFPMEAAMPYILEEAIYLAYHEYGWDTEGWRTNDAANRYCSNPWDSEGLYWPTISDLLIALETVVKAKKFDARLESDYRASLISRLSNLAVGSKGRMLNCKVSVSFDKIISSSTVLEMDDMKDQQDKALLMGLVLARLAEAIKARHKKEPTFKHLTLVEEAHRLLGRPEPNDGGPKRLAVNMFTDMLAEIRKYGEGLIIVDQIPNTLAPEVLKNTNTKIIHKLFARDDREAVGDTIGMSDEQKNYLSRLATGEAIVFSEGWQKPVHAKIVHIPGETAENDGDREKKLQEIGKAQSCEQLSVYWPALAVTHSTWDYSLTMKYEDSTKELMKDFYGIFRANTKLSEKEWILQFEAACRKVFDRFDGCKEAEGSLLSQILTREFILATGSSILKNDRNNAEGYQKMSSLVFRVLEWIRSGDRDSQESLLEKVKNFGDSGNNIKISHAGECLKDLVTVMCTGR